MVSRLLIVTSIILLCGCSPNEKLVSIDSDRIDSISRTAWTFADATSIRQRGDKSTINYKVDYEETYIRAAKKKFADERGYDGLTVIAGWVATVEFDCSNSTYKELAGSFTYDDGRTKTREAIAGRVLPNSTFEKLMNYACMSSVSRTFLNIWSGKNSPL